MLYIIIIIIMLRLNSANNDNIRKSSPTNKNLISNKFMNMITS